MILDECLEHRQQLEIDTRTNLQETIGGPCSQRFTNIDHDHRPIVASSRHVPAFRREGVLREVPGMGLDRVASPVDQQVGAIPHLAQRTRDFSHELRANLARSVGQRSVAVHDAPDPLRQLDGGPLRLGRGVAEAVHEGQVGAHQDVGGGGERRGHRRRASVDQRRQIPVFVCMTAEPRAAERARATGANDALPFGMQFDVVTQAATVRARGVLHD